MSSSTEINARLDAVEESAKGSLQKSYYGIAARLDRIPACWQSSTYCPLASRWYLLL